MKNMEIYLKCLLCIVIAAFVVVPLLPTSKAETSSPDCCKESLGNSVPEASMGHTCGGAPLWTPPHLIPHKDACPRTIWEKDSGWGGEVSTVTLTVDAVGDATNIHVPVDVVLTIDVTGSMAQIYNGSTQLQWAQEAAVKFLDFLNLAGEDRVAIVNFSTYTPGLVQLVQPFTNDKAALTTSINSMVANGGTPLRDAIAFSMDYADQNHAPVSHIHPHQGVPPKGHHQPVVIVLTDGWTNSDASWNDWPSLINFLTQAHYPPPTGKDGYETIIFTIGLGNPRSNVDEPDLIDVAKATEGNYYWCPTPADLKDIYLNISSSIIKTVAAIQPSPTESMITEVLPPYIEYQGAWTPTSNNNAAIRGFVLTQGLGNLWELRWDIPKMKINEVFEVQYDIKSTLPSWQSIGVTSYNATNVYGSDYCKVKYGNWRYSETGDPNDIWTNETNDVSIFVKNWTDETENNGSWYPVHPPPLGIPTAPLEIPPPPSVPIPNLIGHILIQPIMQSLIQPQLMLNTMLQPMMNPVNMPNFVGMVTALGMMEKIKVKRKMRGMRIAVKEDNAETHHFAIGE